MNVARVRVSQIRAAYQILTPYPRGALACLAFEMVVPIRIAAAQGLERTRTEVKHEKKNAPALVLTYVHALMRAAVFEHRMTDADHDVTKRDRSEAEPGRQPRNDASDTSSGNFDHAVYDYRRRATDAGEQRENETDGGSRK